MVNLCVDPRNQNVIVFQRENKIFVLNKNPSKENEKGGSQKKKKKTSNLNISSVSKENFSLDVVKTFDSVSKPIILLKVSCYNNFYNF